MHWGKRACGTASGKNPDHVGHVTATNSPLVFLVCGYNDRPDISEGLASSYLKFKQRKVPAELHIYAGSGHGFGLWGNDSKPAGKWIECLEEWLADSGFLKKL